MISVRNYVTVTAAYWAFTLTDGALRMLVLMHFNQLGYTPVQLAFLFLLYEFFGIVTKADRVSLSVGFYYMANAAGRLLGTLLSGVDMWLNTLIPGIGLGYTLKHGKPDHATLKPAGACRPMASVTPAPTSPPWATYRS